MNRSTEKTERKIPDRGDKFEMWLKDLTPEKVLALRQLERQARLLVSMFILIGEADPKIMKSLILASDAVREAYEAQAKLQEPVAG